MARNRGRLPRAAIDPQRMYVNPGYVETNDANCDSTLSINAAQRRMYTWVAGEPRCTMYNHYYPPNDRTHPDCVANYIGADPNTTYTGHGLSTARSLHSGGVNAGLCDGSGRFVSDSIDLAIWRALAMRVAATLSAISRAWSSMSIDLEPALALPETRPLLQRFLHYGWAPILVGAMAMAATFPGRTHGLGMVTEPLLADLNLADADGRVLYASLNFWGTMIGALFCLPVGWLFDRYDRRWILAGNLILLGLSVWWMSRVENWQQLFVGLVLTRGFGQSALSVVSMTIVAKSFDAGRLGVAMGCYAMICTPFHLMLIQGVGWR